MGFISGICCDGCGLEMYFESIEPKYMIVDRARKNGWSVGKLHLCPQCRKNKKELKKEIVLISN